MHALLGELTWNPVPQRSQNNFDGMMSRHRPDGSVLEDEFHRLHLLRRPGRNP
jgi:hypothetical protein